MKIEWRRKGDVIYGWTLTPCFTIKKSSFFGFGDDYVVTYRRYPTPKGFRTWDYFDTIEECMNWAERCYEAAGKEFEENRGERIG